MSGIRSNNKIMKSGNHYILIFSQYSRILYSKGFSEKENLLTNLCNMMENIFTCI